MKTISCGIIILNEFNEFLVGHSTGNDFYDLPKGHREPNESKIECAVRECKEETGIFFSVDELKELRLFKYTKNKDLHLFLANVKKESIKMDLLECITHFFDNEKRQFPEFDGYEWVHIDDIEKYCTVNMSRVLREFCEENL